MKVESDFNSMENFIIWSREINRSVISFLSSDELNISSSKHFNVLLLLGYDFN